MPVDFPASPATNQIYSYNNKSWTWNGTAWLSTQPSTSIGNTFSSGRLTLSSGTPVPSVNLTSTTVYYTPFSGNRISLYDGSSWSTYAFTERSLALSGTANYDIFMYNNAGTLTLESTAWASDTVRSTALVLIDGVYLKSGALTRRYLGTIRVSGGTCFDSNEKRYVWNLNNKTERIVYKNTFDTYAYTGHTYTAGAWRSWNNDTNQKVEFVVGINSGISVGFGSAGGGFTSQGAAWDGATPGYDSVDVNARAGRTYSTRSNVLGFHYITMMEYGSSGTTYIHAILEGTFWC